ncbi:MAG: hypothetical protein K8F91_23560 [Candidatus Obscuribacterales bacterium]|nr:hypothetical protein [Candidatus Obscuribacterales bacterium]
MSKIPSKIDQKNNAEANGEAARKARIETDVIDFTDLIVEAMKKGETYLSVRNRMPEPEAQTRLIRDFAVQGWNLTFNATRTGGSISWS